MASLGKRKQNSSSDASTSVPKKQKLQETENSADPLQTQLDFTALTTTSDILSRFDTLARALLHDFHLVIRCGSVDTPFEILELEFYLRKAGCHEDPFTHGSEEQKIPGTWYFHRAPKRSLDSHRSETSLTGYRGGTRKGLDLTIGTPPKHVPTTQSPYFSPSPSKTTPEASLAANDAPFLRGGILLRSIRRVTDSKVISGPSLLVDQILSVSKTASIAELVSDKWGGNTCAFRGSVEKDTSGTLLFLRPRGVISSNKPVVYCSPRIGLDLSHPGTTVLLSHPRVVFLPRPYRYFAHPELLTANGRPQTFLGVLRACIDSGLKIGSPKLRMELARITGLKEPSVQKYLADYQGGIDNGSLKAFVGPAGKGASSSPTTYLRMMGILERLKITQV